MNRPFRKATRGPRPAAGRLVLLAVLFLVPGCLTQQAVRDIVDDSNQAIIESNRRLAAGEAAGLDAETGSDWEETVARIDAFIVAHPDDPDLTTPLRLRQAMIFTVHQLDQLALAAFELVKADAAHLHTERDKALLKAHPHLVWWFTAADRNLTGPELAADGAGPKALRAFGEIATSLDRMSDTRVYFEEQRAYLAAHLAQNVTQAAAARTFLVDGAKGYVAMFTEGEIARLRSGDLQAVGGGDVSFRRRLAIFRAPQILGRFGEVAAASDLDDVSWVPAWVGEFTGQDPE